MPEKKPIEAEVDEGAFSALADAWNSLVIANDALAIVNQTGSKPYSRLAMAILRSRTESFLAALQVVIKETQES